MGGKYGAEREVMGVVRVRLGSCGVKTHNGIRYRRRQKEEEEEEEGRKFVWQACVKDLEHVKREMIDV